VRTAVVMVVFSLTVAQNLCGGSGAGNIASVTRTVHSRFVHRIKLHDYEGNTISLESTAPYSPKKTCAPCHDYSTISKGTHIRMFPKKSVFPPAHVWTIFDPATGTQVPISYGFLSVQERGGESVIPLTVFRFAMKYGAFHTGGGRLESDSEGKRYDTRLAKENDLRLELNPDYYQSRWDQSGVLEIDCLMCHSLNSYDHAERAAQIAVMNFKWAPTAGAGFGCVSGKVVQLPPPSPNSTGTEQIKVSYKPSIFDAEGRVQIELGRPPDRNCLYCHRRVALERTSWRDCIDADVHSKAGLKCVDCHRADLQHIVAGDGKAKKELLNKPGFRSLTCGGCHKTGRLGAPRLRHAGLPPIHLEKISCETCHSGARPRKVPMRLAVPASAIWTTVVGSTEKIGATVRAPVFRKDKGGKIRAVVRMLPRWFAERTESGLVPLDPQSLVPLFFRLTRREIKDDDGDGVPEINTRGEINAMLDALQKREINAVYLCGGKAYELDENGDLKIKSNALSAPLDQPLVHNIRPARLALGARGCTECHDRKSDFLLSLALLRAMDEKGKPTGAPLYKLIGKSKFDVRLGALRERFLKPAADYAIILLLVFIGLHYVAFGPRRFQPWERDEDVQRFSALERFVHFCLLLSFLLLAVTGFARARGIQKILHVETIIAHWVCAGVFVLAALTALLLWLRDMLLSRRDIEWLKQLGGYFSRRAHPPAARFNAGQKLFFWFVCAAMLCMVFTGFVMALRQPRELITAAYTVHELLAYLLLLGVIVHIYLGTLANPGTLRGMFEGKVSRAWLKFHHPDYEPPATPQDEEHRE